MCSPSVVHAEGRLRDISLSPVAARAVLQRARLDLQASSLLRMSMAICKVSDATILRPVPGCMSMVDPHSEPG